MATSKTLTPTNVTIQIPDFTDRPDQRVTNNCIDKEADAINALNGKIANDHRILMGTGSFPTTGISYLDDAISNFFAGISSYENGKTYMIDSSGGPYFFFNLMKYTNLYFTALVSCYNSEITYPTCIIKRGNNSFEIVYLSRV